MNDYDPQFDPKRGEIWRNKTHGEVRVLRCGHGVVGFRRTDKKHGEKVRLTRRFTKQFTFVRPSAASIARVHREFQREYPALLNHEEKMYRGLA